MGIDWDVWAVESDEGDRIECRKVVDVETGKSLAFVIRGARIEPGTGMDEPDFVPAFDSFTIDGQDPTEEQADEFTNDLRAIIWDTLTDSPT